jgi:hypothetical protein
MVKTTGAKVSSAAVVHRDAVVPDHTTSPVAAMRSSTLSALLRPGHCEHAPVVPGRGNSTIEATGSSPVKEKIHHWSLSVSAAEAKVSIDRSIILSQRPLGFAEPEERHRLPPASRFTEDPWEKASSSLKLIIKVSFAAKGDLTRIVYIGTVALKGAIVPEPGTTSPHDTAPLFTSSTLMVLDRPKQVPSLRGLISIVETGPALVFTGKARRGFKSKVGSKAECDCVPTIPSTALLHVLESVLAVLWTHILEPPVGSMFALLKREKALISDR